MTLLDLPPEIRSMIFDFCFPPAHTYVQIIPYQISLAACRLNLPVALYSICKSIASELEPLPAKLRRLDLTYIIRGAALTGTYRPEYGSMRDDDPTTHFALIMRFASRVRLVGDGPALSRGRGLSTQVCLLVPGPQCALKVLEVQPRSWRRWFLARVMLQHMGALTTHPDVVAARLQINLIRDTKDPFEDVEQVKARVREFHKRREETGAPGPIWVDLAALDGPEREVKTNIGRIEAWLKRFEEVTDMGHR
ncbi:hypothetical protein C8R46DRAFT_1106316, partial [Mycena filopes]